MRKDEEQATVSFVYDGSESRVEVTVPAFGLTYDRLLDHFEAFAAAMGYTQATIDAYRIEDRSSTYQE